MAIIIGNKILRRRRNFKVIKALTNKCALKMTFAFGNFPAPVFHSGD